MKKLNTFYILGTVGLVITVILQMFLALILNIENTMISFTGLYMTWITFLIIGTNQFLKAAKASKK